MGMWKGGMKVIIKVSRTGEIPDSYVDAFYRLADGDTRQRCPECRCPMSFNPDIVGIDCPKCGYISKQELGD